MNWLGKQVKRDGRRVRRVIDELHNAALILRHKGGKTVSLNTRRKKEIMEYLDRFL